MSDRRAAVAVAAVAGVACVALLGACSSEDRVAEAEEGIAGVLGERLGVSADDVEVACPDDAELEEGSTLSCDVTIGEAAAAEVPFEIHDGGSVRLAAAVLPSIAVERHLRTQLAEAAEGDVEVDCGAAPLLVREVGGTFPCDVTRDADGVAFEVEVEVRSLDGSVTYTVASTTTTATTATTVPAIPVTPP